TLPDLDVTTCGLFSSLVPMGRVSFLFASEVHGGLQPGVFRLQGQCLLVSLLRQLVVRLVILRGEILGHLVGEFAQDDPSGRVVRVGLERFLEQVDRLEPIDVVGADRMIGSVRGHHFRGGDRGGQDNQGKSNLDSEHVSGSRMVVKGPWELSRSESTFGCAEMSPLGAPSGSPALMVRGTAGKGNSW